MGLFSIQTTISGQVGRGRYNLDSLLGGSEDLVSDQ